MYDDPGFQRLAEALADPRIAELTATDRPLTREHLEGIDSTLLAAVEDTVADGLEWPTDDTAVAVSGDDEPYYDDARSFGERAVRDRATYNNFPIILAAKPNRPHEGEGMMEFMHRDRLYSYVTKPYLHRAHAVAPEFMGALQRIVKADFSMADWVDALSRAVIDEQPDPKDELMLKASKAAYDLCVNLMRRDDLQIQYRMLGMSTDMTIDDPTLELRT